MATDQNTQYHTYTFVAGADLSAAANRGKFVKLDASGNVVLAGLGEDAIGVLNNRPALGEEAEVQTGGIAKVQVGAAVAIDAKLMANASGQGITAVAAAGRHVLAKALEAGGAAGDFISAFLTPAPHTILA